MQNYFASIEIVGCVFCKKILPYLLIKYVRIFVISLRLTFAAATRVIAPQRFNAQTTQFAQKT